MSPSSDVLIERLSRIQEAEGKAPHNAKAELADVKQQLRQKLWESNPEGALTAPLAILEYHVQELKDKNMALWKENEDMKVEVEETRFPELRRSRERLTQARNTRQEQAQNEATEDEDEKSLLPANLCL